LKPGIRNNAAQPATGRNYRLTRRRALQSGVAGMIASIAGLSGRVAAPRRVEASDAPPASLPNIQFDIDSYLTPASDFDGTLFQLGPVFTLFVTAALSRNPTTIDQNALGSALQTIEEAYPFSPGGVFSCLSYGVPYFIRLPGGTDGALVSEHMPALLMNESRYALEEAVPSPTDVSTRNPGIVKQSFNIPVSIEQNDLLFTLRSDNLDNLTDVAAWLSGSNSLAGTATPPPAIQDLLKITSLRVMFVQPGLPRRIADDEQLPYAGRIHPQSPLWMGFASQQADSIGSAASATFDGTAAARFTTASAGDYFAGGAIQHLSHIILDLGQWFGDDQPYLERVQQMFRSNPPPSHGVSDQFTNGGGPTYLPNAFAGRDDARQNAIGELTLDGARRIGHSSALQRASRGADGKPFHVRVDGAGFDNMDSPSGEDLPKLHFSIFMPSAESFERMRRYQAATDLAGAYNVPSRHNGIERFFTATRRQNFLVPSRQHRAFPLVELI
jgi:hypothetical protein